MMKKDKYIWLFGENNGNTMNNNSYYFWKQSVIKEDEIEKYYVVKKTKENLKKYKSLTKIEKKHIIWQNSYKHWRIYLNSNLFFVSLSYKDVTPNKILFKKCDIHPKKPLIYLQHGTLGIKKLGYNGRSYNNNMFKFVIYNKTILDQFSEENDFKKYQLYYSEYHPRYMELVRKSNSIKEENQILWFITWREVFDNGEETRKLLNNIKRVIENEKLQEYQEKNNLKLKICLHTLFTEKQIKYLEEKLGDKTEIVYASKIDVMDEIVKSKLLITDYSSLGFDFTFLNKPVLLYVPDLQSYLANREIYCTTDELEENSYSKPRQLIEKILSGKYEINNFFKKRLPDNINYEYVKNGEHIDKMYEDFKNMQLNSIAFIGYNFFGRGGTISATYALAEGLLEKGYLIYMMSLKQTKPLSEIIVPYGLNINSIYKTRPKRKIEHIKRLMIGKWHYSYLKYDSNLKYLIPYAGYGLKRYLKNIKVNTMVSTRETLHLFLNDTNNNNINNKIYFFHTDGNVVDDIFPGVISMLNEKELSKCAFVTELNRKRYIDKLSFNNYKDYMVIGNSLMQNSIISKEEIHTVDKKEVFTGIYLTRISKDRTNDLNNAVEFAKYLKENNIENIKINVYGTGDYVNEFEDILYDNELDDYLIYNGLTLNPHEELIKHDFVVDFSLNQSFGMSYIEGILNGLKVFAYENFGSKEVLEGIADSFILSNDDLVKKINNLPSISKEEYIKNYEVIYDKYSNAVVADKFIDLIKK